MGIRPAVPVSTTLLAGLIALTVVGAVIRSWGLVESFWIDELHTAWVVQDGWFALTARARQGNQSPAYFVIPWLSQALLGPSEWSLRLPSWLAGALVPGTLAVVARRMGASVGGALLAAALVTVDPRAIFYAQEARCYAVVQLVAVCHLGTLIARLAGRGHARVRIAWVATAVTLFYLHYTTALALLAELMVVALIAVAGRATAGGMVRTFLGDLLLVGLGCLPELGEVLEVAARRGNWAHFLAPESPWLVFDLWTYVGAPLGGLAIGVASRCWSSDQPLFWRPQLAATTALVGWIVVPWAIATLVSATGLAPLLLYRYLMSSAAALPLIPAWAVTATVARWARGILATGVLLVAMLSSGPVVTLLTQGQMPLQRGEDWRGVTLVLNGRSATDGRPILLCPGLVEDRMLAQRDPAVVAFCRFPLESLYPLAPHAAPVWPLPTLDPGRLTEEQATESARRGGVWLIVRGDEALEAEILADLRAAWSAHRRRLTRVELRLDSGVRLSEIAVE